MQCLRNRCRFTAYRLISAGLQAGRYLMLGLLISTAAHAADSGLLWKVESPAGKISYLFGTMHSDDKRINNFSPALLQALADSNVFFMETLPPQDPTLFMMPEGVKLSEMLTEPEFDRVRELADFHSMHIEAAMRMKPWLLAVIFDLPKPQTPYAQDMQLMSKAEDGGKPVKGLEEAAEHFASLDSLTLDEQLVMLKAVLKRSQRDKERDFEALLKAYVRGDTAKILALDNKITGGLLPPALWSKMKIKLLDERNETMAQRLVEAAGEGSVFAAVGAAHLAGKNGLIAKLREAGFKLTPAGKPF